MPDQITIALWGPSKAGKTAFLAQLYLHPRSLSDDWRILPTRESTDFLHHVRGYISQNKFPEPTDTARNVKYMFKNVSTGREAVLFVEDRSGRESTQLDDEGRKRLNSASGLILLFDPTSNPLDLANQIEEALTDLHTAANREFDLDHRPIAVCLSKSDLLIETPVDLHRAQKYPREFVLEKISPNIVDWVSRFCTKFELFPTSSLGVRVRHGVVEPMVFYDEEFNLRFGSGSRPLNLIEPFSWLFSQIERGIQT